MSNSSEAFARTAQRLSCATRGRPMRRVLPRLRRGTNSTRSVAGDAIHDEGLRRVVVAGNRNARRLFLRWKVVPFVACHHRSLRHPESPESPGTMGPPGDFVAVLRPSRQRMKIAQGQSARAFTAEAGMGGSSPVEGSDDLSGGQWSAPCVVWFKSRRCSEGRSAWSDSVRAPRSGKWQTAER